MKAKLLFLFNAIKEFNYDPFFIISNLVAVGVIFFIVFNIIMSNVGTINTIVACIVLVSCFIAFNLNEIVNEYTFSISYATKSNSIKPYQKVPIVENEIDSTPIIDETSDGKYVIINGKKYIKSMMKDSIIQGVLNKTLKPNSIDFSLNHP